MSTNLLLDGFYYPVAQSKELGDKPMERIIGNRSITLFRGRAGRVSALDSECPHRGANLARGWVHDGCLACPYHGWRFERDGTCVDVPSHPDRPIPQRSTARSYPVVEQQGIIWLCTTSSSPTSPPPRFDHADDASLRRFAIEDVVTGPIDWWMDNFTDISHVPFVHPKSFGARHPAVETHPVRRRDDELGYHGKAVVRYHYGLLARLVHGSIRPYHEELSFTVFLPGVVQIIIDMGSGHRQILVLFASPVDDDHTRVIITVWRNYLTWLPLADRIGSLFLRRTLYEDELIVKHSIERHREPGQAVMHADKIALELHRLLRVWRERQRSQARPYNRSSSAESE